MRYAHRVGFVEHPREFSEPPIDGDVHYHEEAPNICVCVEGGGADSGLEGGGGGEYTFSVFSGAIIESMDLSDRARQGRQ